MNKWIIIAALTLLLLTIRAFYKHTQKLRYEKVWYINQLNFQFSAHVDSLAAFPKDNHGFVYFHLTDGFFGRSAEDKVNEELKYNNYLRFIRYSESSKLWFNTGELDKYQPGDSIRVNTTENKITIYRNRKLLAESEIAMHLSGRLF